MIPPAQTAGMYRLVCCFWEYLSVVGGDPAAPVTPEILIDFGRWLTERDKKFLWGQIKLADDCLKGNCRHDAH